MEMSPWFVLLLGMGTVVCNYFAYKTHEHTYGHKGHR